MPPPDAHRSEQAKLRLTHDFVTILRRGNTQAPGDITVVRLLRHTHVPRSEPTIRLKSSALIKMREPTLLRRTAARAALPWFTALIAAAQLGCEGANGGAPPSKAELGELLFHDPNLSKERTQSCATCHAPEAVFTDPRPLEGGIAAASIGDDGQSLGDRNAPSAMYAAFIPPLSRGSRARFHTDPEISLYEGYLGGVFLDGRARDLAEQAGGPPLNPVEMGMPSEEAVVARLLEDAEYPSMFRALYGEGVFDDAKVAYAAMSDAIAAFERTEAFSPFDSRYDRSLLSKSDPAHYEYPEGSPAARGRDLFFSTEATSCSTCHLMHQSDGPDRARELFSSYEYHNLGLPENQTLRRLNGAKTDLGLGGVLDDPTQNGKFRVGTLRNVALTGPYMHNGVFQNLSTVILFYEHAKKRARGESDASQNPETGESWAEPEVDENLSTAELSRGSEDLSRAENLLALECFLVSLTDARYESALPPSLVARCGL